MADLKSARQNPWYVLSTLYGEQKGPEIDDKLAAKNVELWNIWSCQNLDEKERVVLRDAGAEVPDAKAWLKNRADITELFVNRMAKADIADAKLPDAGAGIDISNVSFDNTVVWKKAIFCQAFNAHSASFGQGVHFNSANFHQGAIFGSAKFSHIALFSHAIFKQFAYFNVTTFVRGASFDFATFLRDASFDYCTFRQITDFSSATFTRAAKFGSAKFLQEAYFGSTKFLQETYFGSVTFEGLAYFWGTQFGTSVNPNEYYRVSFDEAIFERPTSFRGSRFRHRYPALNGTLFHDKTQFTAEREFWPEGAQPDPKQAKEACATLRHVVAKQSLPEDEYFFFRREMEFAGEIGGFWRTLPYKSYGWVSDYGTSIAKPATRLFGVWLVFAILYMSAFNWPGVVNAEFVPAGKGFGFSLANMFKFFGFQRTYYYDLIQNLPSWLQFAAAAQTVLSYILVFFLGLGLRARFRLR